MENIDKIYYINLDHRLDRKKQFEQQIESHLQNNANTNANILLDSRIERFAAIENIQGLLGCSMSHLEVIKKAKQANARYILVFEDDFEFIVSKDIFENNITNLFKLVNAGLDFKVVMLAYNAQNIFPCNDICNALLYKTTDVQTCAGYLVNSAYFDELIECWSEGVKLYQETGQDWIYCCDQYWKKLQKEKWFLFKTRIGKQCAGFSDCGKRFTDYGL
jgi:GR25 family glycosyltransferase involved in LPS biosynthesis